MNINKIKNRTGIFRSDINFIKEMRENAKFRYFKNLEKKQPSDAEMTRLLMRTNGWKISKEELRLKPRKENL